MTRYLFRVKCQLFCLTAAWSIYQVYWRNSCCCQLLSTACRLLTQICHTSLLQVQPWIAVRCNATFSVQQVIAVSAMGLCTPTALRDSFSSQRERFEQESYLVMVNTSTVEFLNASTTRASMSTPACFSNSFCYLPTRPFTAC